MKKIILLQAGARMIMLFLLIIFSGSAYSQNGNLYATATDGGAYGYGTILVSDSSGNNFHTISSFNYTNGSYPQGKLVIAPNGLVYGATRRGGFSNSCVLYTFDTTSNTITKIYDFMYTTQLGAIPYSGLMLASDCYLYGVTFDGGANGGGVIYSLDPAGDYYTDLYDFIDSTGSHAFGELLQLSDGKLYGLASSGGQNSGGVLFSFDPVNQIYSALHHFINATGSDPAYGNLIQATDGLLYGMTQYGGPTGNGVIFSYDVSSGIYTDRHDFDYATGGYPFGSLMQSSTGKLYGMTITGGVYSHGVLFSFDASTNNYTVLQDFDNTNGAGPQRGLTEASNGKLFGTTMHGGIHNCGVIFSYDTVTSTYTKVLDFDSITTGAHPTCDIFQSGVSMNPCITHVHEGKDQTAISFFPNPVQDRLNIYSTDFTSATIEISNALGANVYFSNEKGRNGTFSKVISMNNVTDGIYFLKITSPEKVWIRKFLVSR